MRLVERHIIKDNRFEDVCLKSGLLYNYVLFNVRQGIFSGDYIDSFVKYKNISLRLFVGAFCLSLSKT